MSERPRIDTRSVAVTMAILIVGSACDIVDPGDEECISNPSPAFTHMVTDLTQLRAIVPLGTPGAGDIKERHQVQIIAGRNVPVIAPARGRVDNIRHIRATSPPAPYEDDYWGVVLVISCEVTVRLDHIRTPGERLRTAIPGNTNQGETPDQEMFYEAGEVIGFTGGFIPGPPNMPRGYGFDYAVYNSEHENTFVNMQRYRTTNDLWNSLHVVCGGLYYSGSLRSDFYNKLGYEDHTAAGDCRSGSRDVAGALSGGWFRPGLAPRADGWQLAFASEVEGSIRFGIHPATGGQFYPIRTTGTVNLDPALATGTAPYCYTSPGGLTEWWFQMSADGLRMSVQQRSPGNCTGSPPASYSMQWER